MHDHQESHFHVTFSPCESSQPTLSDIPGYRASTVTGVIDRLEKKDLVKRRRISQDRRVITVELTKSGKMLAENAPSPIQQKIIDGLNKLSQSKIEQIALTLKRLTDMLDVRDLKFA